MLVLYPMHRHHAGHAAYRTQLFCYLKSCGRDELNTFNLWQGIDGQMQ